MNNVRFIKKTSLKSFAIIFILCISIQVFSQQHILNDYAAINGAMSYSMVGSEVYDTEREWSYTPKQTTVIGVPFTPVPVQVTFDGAIYTRDSELFFFYGKDKKPLCAMQKTFYEGWIPIIEYDWVEDNIKYHIEFFGFSLKNEGPQNSIQFVNIKIKNASSEKKQIDFGAATRASGLDHRMGGPDFNANSIYKFDKNEFYRDDKIIYHFSGNPDKYAIKDNLYSAPFSSETFEIKRNTSVGIINYSLDLNPNEEYEITLKYPRVAIFSNETDFIEKFRNSVYDYYRSDCIDFWKKTIEGNGYFQIPEKRVNDSYKASLVHLMLATRTHDNGKKRQGSGLPYDGIFFNDFIDMRLIYDAAGHHDFVELNFDWLKNSVNEEGLFVDSSVSHNREIMTSHGQALYSVCNHFLYKDDKKLAKEMLNTVQKAVGLIANDHKTQPNGLVRPSLPFDAEMIEGYYTSHNLWCLLGLRSAILYAEYLGLNNLSTQWRSLELSYRKALLLAIEQSAHQDGYVPTGLYKFKTGKDTGWEEFRSNQDWENMLLVYPTEALSVNDKKVTGTLSHIRKIKFREGIMTYRNGMHLHQYATTNLTNQHIVLNDQITALYDMYHILLHNGSTHEGFENMIEPWGDRDPEPIPGPHAWAAAKTALLIRNSLVREFGGEAGINKNERSLYLFSVISPAWDKPNEKIEIINARTEFGIINASMLFKEKGATISITNNFIRNPQNIYIAIPHFKTLKNIKSSPIDNAYIENGYLVCASNTKTIDLEWDDKHQINHLHAIIKNYRKEPGIRWDCPTPDVHSISPKNKIDKGGVLIVIPGLEDGYLTDDELSLPPEKLSFNLVKKAYLTEYSRRRLQFLDANKKLLNIAPPAFE